MKALIVANWKCNPPSFKEAKLLWSGIRKGVRKIKKVKVVICPPFIYLPILTGLTGKGSGISAGAQDCFWENPPSGGGAFTGEISARQIYNMGCRYVILGHSERRKYFQESDEKINQKIKAALSENLIPLLCIGESKEEKDQGQAPQKIESQIKKGLVGISREKLKRIIIAYEPIWAIGTRIPCPPEDTYGTSILIRKIINNAFGKTLAKNIPVLYGGSVNSENAAGYIKEGGVQGLLVGSASLDSKEFVKLIKNVSKN